MERLWGPLTWLYYRGCPANTSSKICYGDFGVHKPIIVYMKQVYVYTCIINNITDQIYHLHVLRLAHALWK